MVIVLPAILTPPAPDKVVIDAPLLTALISKVPVTDTEDEVATEPTPDKAKVPAVIVVTPV
ncbi:hypothetical protein POBR111598_10015 [Polynucleobacter brandtiae]